tara:strand:- start:24841 stop:29403 length:4563 start_codon:yes stop_codon:yes gene_type:complete
MEFESAGYIYTRKGAGADAGVEAYADKPGNGRIGIQAKYVFEWGDGLRKQLNESIDAALQKNLRLETYHVCIPFNLPAGVQKGKTSARNKWENWAARWIEKAADHGRALTIELWDESALLERLMRAAPAYSGRLAYWFDVSFFGMEWFHDRFRVARTALGSRYTPATNVDLDLKGNFEIFTRSFDFHGLSAVWKRELAGDLRSVLGAFAGSTSPSEGVQDLSKAVLELSATFESDPTPTDELPVGSWLKLIAKTHDSVRYVFLEASSLSSVRPDHGGYSDRDAAYRVLGALDDTLSQIRDELGTAKWTLANHRFCALLGEAGVGKSHLLADVVSDQISQKRPALILLGQQFELGDPWAQVAQQLGLTHERSVLLGALDAAGEACSARTLICIDAINERNGIDIWPQHLGSFFAEAEPYKHLCIVLSCRSTFANRLIPPSFGAEQLGRVYHVGFGGTGGRAARAYLATRGITLPGAPTLTEEFDNPLFLRTCCDFLDASGKSELPRGMTGVSETFRFYHQAAIAAINSRLRLNPKLKIVEQAFGAFVSEVRRNRSQFLAYTSAHEILDHYLPSSGDIEGGLLTNLINEGVLSEEIQAGADPTDEPIEQDVVRFTFERFGDYMIAEAMLDEYADRESATNAFSPGGKLHEFVCGEKAYRNAGVIEALAVLLPERWQVELPDAVQVEGDNLWDVNEAFLTSLKWRQQVFYSKRSDELAAALLPADRFLDLRVSISTEPDNEFNANHLDTRLRAFSMPERDTIWSAYLLSCEEGESGPYSLIEWAWENGFEAIEPNRARLCAVTLTWFLTTSNRHLRDRATKALATILAPRLRLAADLLRSFSVVDDPYVCDRLLAAAYGAALQNLDPTNLSNLSHAAYENFFSTGKTTCNESIRDSARSIVLYAQTTGHLASDIDPLNTIPPHAGAEPIEYVPDSVIDTYREEYGPGHFHSDEIVGSAVNDGDFARYVIDGIADDWAISRIDAKEPQTPSALFEEWADRFQATASPAALKAYEALLKVAKKYADNRPFPQTDEEAEIDKASAEFRDTISSDQWEEFRTRAQPFILGEMFSKRERVQNPAQFDPSLARRWICKRAHDLGWTQERFGEIDRALGAHDRNEHRRERIGKKYQWIALHEFVGRVSDTQFYLGSGYSSEPGDEQYESALQTRVRELDPSLLMAKSNRERGRQTEAKKYWWSPIGRPLRSASPEERLNWLLSDRDLYNDASMIAVQSLEADTPWLVLHGSRGFRGEGEFNGEVSWQRDVWCRIDCVAVKRNDKARLVKSIRGKRLTDPYSIPRLDFSGDYYLGEFPWHPRLAGNDDWVAPNRWLAVGAPVRPLVARYLCERGNFDYSLDDTVSLEMPAPWLANILGLKLLSGKQPSYVDKCGQKRFFDPSVLEPGPSAAVVDRTAFLGALSSVDCEPVWIISGEKSVHGSSTHSNAWGGARYHTGVYTIDAGKLEGCMTTFVQAPSRSQFAEFSEGENLEDWFEKIREAEAAQPDNPPKNESFDDIEPIPISWVFDGDD